MPLVEALNSVKSLSLRPAFIDRLRIARVAQAVRPGLAAGFADFHYPNEGSFTSVSASCVATSVCLS